MFAANFCYSLRNVNIILNKKSFHISAIPGASNFKVTSLIPKECTYNM